MLMYFKECHPTVLFITEIKPKSVLTKSNFIYYTEQDVSSSASQFVFKNIEVDLISGFRRDSDEICTLLGYNAGSRVKKYKTST
jgi:hypothetical protein